MPELKTLDNRPLLMQPIKHAGREGVARAVGAYNGAWGQSDRAQGKARSVASAHDRALGKGSPRPAHGATREHVLDCARDCGRISRAVGPPRLASPQRADLVVVDDEPIEMRQGWPAEFGAPVGLGCHEFEIR